MNSDDEHIKLLSTFHYILGGMGCFFSCFPLIHVGMGLFFIFGGDQFFENGGNAPPDFFGWIFVIMGLLFFLFGQALSISIIISGRFMSRRQKYMFSFVVACISCTLVPFGTILGIFTIIILSRNSVKTQYDQILTDDGQE